MIRYRNTSVGGTKVQALAAPNQFGYFIRGFNVINPNTTDVYLKFYDALSANVTVGTTTPTLTLMIPASGSVYEPYDINKVVMFANNGVTIVAVTGLADSSTAAPSSNIHVSFQYD